MWYVVNNITSRAIARHIKRSHKGYGGKDFLKHDMYPQWFHFITPNPRTRCPNENRPPREMLEGIKGVNFTFLGYNQNKRSRNPTTSTPGKNISSKVIVPQPHNRWVHIQ